jgi:hypothetical protein
MDWAKWHDNYKVSPALKERLSIVRKHLSKCCISLPKGSIKIISICSGDGRDLLGLMEYHPRKQDVSALLVENNEELVDTGRKSIHEAGFETQLKLVLSDATLFSTYDNYCPANIVLFSGVFGNVRVEETPNIIRNLRSLCNTDSYIIWTRHCRVNNGLKHIEFIRNQFTENDFEETYYEQTADGTFIIGTNKFCGNKIDLSAETKLFDFVGYDKL